MNQDHALVVVVIPIYKEKPTETELKSLEQCLAILGNRKLVLICPSSIHLAAYNTCLGFDKIEKRHMSEHYFKSIEGYNELMLSKHFYQQFSSFKYMLIYQLDAWIFEDNLDMWCARNYDYIGAPWIGWEWSSFYARHITFPRRLAYKFGYRNFNLVGNGGFSLRKISSTIFNLTLLAFLVRKFKQNEDYFFSFVVNSYNPFFKIAPFKEALAFAFDEHPDEAFRENQSKLPMACHAWPKYLSFWEQYIYQ